MGSVWVKIGSGGASDGTVLGVVCNEKSGSPWTYLGKPMISDFKKL